jgi:hypothetical protein
MTDKKKSLPNEVRFLKEAPDQSIPTPKSILNYNNDEVVIAIKQEIEKKDDFTVLKITHQANQYYNVVVSFIVPEEDWNFELDKYKYIQLLHQFRVDLFTALSKLVPVVNVNLAAFDFIKGNEQIKFALTILLSDTNNKDWVTGKVKQRPDQKERLKLLQTESKKSGSKEKVNEVYFEPIKLREREFEYPFQDYKIAVFDIIDDANVGFGFEEIEEFISFYLRKIKNAWYDGKKPEEIANFIIEKTKNRFNEVKISKKNALKEGINNEEGTWINELEEDMSIDASGKLNDHTPEESETISYVGDSEFIHHFLVNYCEEWGIPFHEKTVKGVTAVKILVDELQQKMPSLLPEELDAYLLDVSDGDKSLYFGCNYHDGDLHEDVELDYGFAPTSLPKNKTASNDKPIMENEGDNMRKKIIRKILEIDSELHEIETSGYDLKHESNKELVILKSKLKKDRIVLIKALKKYPLKEDMATGFEYNQAAVPGTPTTDEDFLECSNNSKSVKESELQEGKLYRLSEAGGLITDTVQLIKKIDGKYLFEKVKTGAKIRINGKDIANYIQEIMKTIKEGWKIRETLPVKDAFIAVEKARKIPGVIAANAITQDQLMIQYDRRKVNGESLKQALQKV